LKKHDDLSILINSLSKSEKRYVVLSLSGNLRKGKSNLLELFKLIDVLNQSNRIITAENIADKTSIKHLNAVKKQLKETVLRSLRAFHDGMNSRWRIDKYRKNCEIYMSKRLPRLALKEIHKAIQIAFTHELDFLLSELQMLRLECHKSLFNLAELPGEIEASYSAIRRSQESASEFFKRKEAFEVLRANFKARGVARTRQEISANTKLYDRAISNIDSSEKLSHKYIIEEARSIHFFSIGMFEESYQCSRAMVGLLEGHAEEKESSTQYLTAIYNLIVGAYFTDRMDDVRYNLQKMKAAKTSLFTDYLFQQERYFNIAFNVYFNNQNMEKLLGLVSEFSDLFKKVEQHMDREFRLILIGQCANICLFTNDVRSSKSWNNLLLLESHTKIRRDIISTALMRDLIITFEEKKQDLLLYKLKNVKQRLSSKRRLYSAELAVIKAIKEIIDKGLMESNIEILEKIESVFEDEQNKRILDQFNYLRYFRTRQESF